MPFLILLVFLLLGSSGSGCSGGGCSGGGCSGGGGCRWGVVVWERGRRRDMRLIFHSQCCFCFLSRQDAPDTIGGNLSIFRWNLAESIDESTRSLFPFLVLLTL